MLVQYLAPKLSGPAEDVPARDPPFSYNRKHEHGTILKFTFYSKEFKRMLTNFERIRPLHSSIVRFVKL